MDGNNVSEPLSARKKLEAVNTRLDDFEANLGIKFRLLPSIQNEALKYLEIEAEQRRKLTPDECAEAVVILAQYAANVHRAYQRESAQVRWSEDEICKVVAPQLAQYDKYMKHDFKVALAVRENIYATELNSIRAESQAKCERLNFLATRIGEIAEAFRGLSFTRKRDREYGER